MTRNDDFIDLDRQFEPLPKSNEAAEEILALARWGFVKPKTWDDLEREYRCVILAEAGAGKTEELFHRAKCLDRSGRAAFFIKIEDIESNFQNSFEIGSQAGFDRWLESTEEAWFFLDSVDESRIQNPRYFEKAMQWFAHGVHAGIHRAHIFLSSRPYAWRASEDSHLLNRVLSCAGPDRNFLEGDGDVQSEPRSALTIYRMCPLDRNRIYRFCSESIGNNVDHLLSEIDRAGLWSMAERPFDLGAMLAKWEKDQSLNNRLECLRFIVDKRLNDNHSTDRRQRQPLNQELAKQGARRLAAAVIFTGQVSLSVPDSAPEMAGIKPEDVLHEWSPSDVSILLQRGIFNDAIYGAVRFRNRDVCELLAAEWIHELLQRDQGRRKIKKLFFCEQYGQPVLRPRLRRILPWLILFDENIRSQAIEISPEVAIEEGDPSGLPLLAKQQILSGLIRKICSGVEMRSAHDRSSIIRIARDDLAPDIQRYIEDYLDNDRVIYFLSLLVWLGKMSNCVNLLLPIACDGSRDLSVRRASALAAMACGSCHQRKALWQTLNEGEEEMPHDLLKSLIQEALPEDVDCLLVSLCKLARPTQHNLYYLCSLLRAYIERLVSAGSFASLEMLADGLNSYLDQRLLLHDLEYGLSENSYWLADVAMWAVEKLIRLAGDGEPSELILNILSKMPELKYSFSDESSACRENLKILVPNYPSLNEALYWRSVERARSSRMRRGQCSSDDWPVECMDHCWDFDANSFASLVDSIESRSLQDDKIIAVHTAFRVYDRLGRPEELLMHLRSGIDGNQALIAELNRLLQPTMNMMAHQVEERRQQRQETNMLQDRDLSEKRAFIRDNPKQINNRQGLNPGEVAPHIIFLMNELCQAGSGGDSSSYANWEKLSTSYNEAVASSYKCAAMQHWRAFTPLLRSEGEQAQFYSNPLLFAMAGLEIEAKEVVNFPLNLSADEVCLALRYLTYHPNGFPSWFEDVYKGQPELAKEAVLRELAWEVQNAQREYQIHHILHSLAYHAPWLHRVIAPSLFDLIKENPLYDPISRECSLRILVFGGIDAAELAGLAIMKITSPDNQDSIPAWYALLVDCDPDNGIPRVKDWLTSLQSEDASYAAQNFVSELMGENHGRDGKPYHRRINTVPHLKALYLLMRQFIQHEDNIDRRNMQEYTLGLRDYAQRAVEILLEILARIPGKSTFAAIHEMIDSCHDSNICARLKALAFKRLEQDSELEPWTILQFNQFHRELTMIPETHDQLFSLAVELIEDLKEWLENGNDSPSCTWRNVNDETEMRNLILGQLRIFSRGRCTFAQEAELANAQRPDIWVQNPDVDSPVPVELKLLEKWSGPQLCERLRNQLVGDYLRERNARSGVMLLVWRGSTTREKWKINGSMVDLSQLAEALKGYWQSIEAGYPEVDELSIILFDLTRRAQVSAS